MRATTRAGSPALQHWRARDAGPTERERRILRQIAARGGLALTYQNGGLSFSFHDGGLLKDQSSFDRRLFHKFTELAWIVPTSPALFPGMSAQRYEVAPEFRS